MKKEFPNDNSVSFIEFFLYTTSFKDLEKWQQKRKAENNADTDDLYRNVFFSYYLINETLLFDFFLQEKMCPDNLFDGLFRKENIAFSNINNPFGLIQLYIVGVWLFDLSKRSLPKLQQAIDKLYSNVV